MDERLNTKEQAILLKIARNSIVASVCNEKLTRLETEKLAPRLKEKRATFVTLTIEERLRGCVGGLDARMPLVEDVRDHAIAAAMEDYRFQPVGEDELDNIRIEISVLTPPAQLVYETAEDLLEKLRPGIDGVVIYYQNNRVTYLPQVWEKLPEKYVFMNYLCEKFGLPANTWRKQHLEVFTYQVEEFHE